MRTRLALALAASFFTACGTEQRKDERGRERQPAGLRDTCTNDTALAPATALLMAASESSEVLELTRRLNQGLPPGLTARLVAADESVGARHYDFRYESDEGLPLCRHLVRTHFVGDDRLIDGELSARVLPPIVDLSALRWQDERATALAAARALGEADAALELKYAERCFSVGPFGLQARWDLRFRLDGHPYQALANGDHVESVQSRTFNVMGSARVFDTGPVDGQLVDVELKDLLPGDGLASARFTSVVDAGPRAAEASRVYHYDPADERFAEVSAFTHLEQMAEWLTQPSHHYKMDCVPISVHTHAVFRTRSGSTINNAEYSPPDKEPNGFPAIKIGDGDGRILQNIPLDFDAVAHELGHHVIYRKLKAIDGESLVLHEGLADYLVFAKTGNACIGESLCPLGSLACERPTRCLRSGDNTLNFTDPDLPLEEHERAQLVSGMLWDLGNDPVVGQDVVAALVIKAVDYLLPSSGYEDFFKALMAADLELHSGAHACKVREHADRRGFTDLIAGLDCSRYQKTRR